MCTQWLSLERGAGETDGRFTPSPSGIKSTQARLHVQLSDVFLDPGLLISYNDEAIHDAVANGGNGCPVPQGQTIQQTAAAFKLYVYNIVLNKASIRQEDNCVEQSQGPGVVYFPHVFHRMSDTQYRQVKAALTETFVTDNAAVTRWSLGLNHPLGTVFKITGRLEWVW